MSWDETRGGTGTATRRAAHSDDAKDRVDEARDGAPRGPRVRPRWFVPAAVVVLLLLLGGGATAALVSAGGDDDPPVAAAEPTSPAADPDASESPAGPAVDPGTGLPLEPVSTDVAYTAVIACVEPGAFVLSNCPSTFVETMTCPGGACRIAFFVGPGVADFRFGSPDTVEIPFQAGAPSISFRGSDGGEPCPGRLRVDGTRQADGGYSIRLVNGNRAGEADGSCSRPSDAVYTVTLTAP